MALQLEDDYSLERTHPRRWVSIIAVVIPVAAIGLGAAWFVRVYVAPPTITFPNPMTLLAEVMPTPASREKVEVPPLQMATRDKSEVLRSAMIARERAEPARPPVVAREPQMAQPAAPAQPMPTMQTAKVEPAAPMATTGAAERREPALATPMAATLAAAPPAFNSASPAFADPADASAAGKPEMVGQSAALELSEPIAGPVPLPHAKPHARVALVTAAIPLPRPRPADDTPAPSVDDVAAFSRHGAE